MVCNQGRLAVINPGMSGLIVMLLAATVAAPVRPIPQLEYHFRAGPASGPGRLRVAVTFAGTDSGVTLVVLPSRWANQQELWRDLDSLVVRQGNARLEPGPEPWLRRLVHAPGARITLEYVVRQGFTEALDRANWYRAIVQPDWFLVTGNAAIAHPDGDAAESLDVDLRFDGLEPPAVAITSHGLGARQQARLTRRELVQTLVAGGALRVIRRRAAGTDLAIVTRGEWRFTDSALGDRIAAVTAGVRRFWGEDTPWRYLVTLVGAGSGGNFGGTRLHRAFATFVGPEAGLEPGLTRLFAHEFMHEWIGGRLRAGEQPEVRSYWFTEGFTDFLTHRALWRAGLASDSAYAAAVNEAWREATLSPVGAAPYDLVETGFWTDRDLGRVPYVRGHLFGLMLDERIRAAGTRRSGLEDTLRDLLRGAGPTGLAVSDSAFVAALAPLVPDAAALLAAHIRAGRAIPAPPSILGCLTLGVDSIAPFTLGLAFEQSRREGRLTGVDSAGPAFAAGLRNGQAVRGWSVRFGDVTRDVEITIREGDADRTVRYRPMGARRVPVPRYAPVTPCRRS